MTEETTEESPRPEITEQLVDHVETFLGTAGINYFEKLKEENKDEIPLVISEHEDVILPQPHAVHFHEGMQIRNAMRDSGLVEDWDAHQLDDYWIEVVEMVLDRQK